MPDPSSPATRRAPKLPRGPSLRERLVSLISGEPDSREDLAEVLDSAHKRDLLDDDALAMMHGVLAVGEMTAADIMVPRQQMDVVDITQPLQHWLDQIIETSHSRFPAVEGDVDHCVGLLLAKDLLRLTRDGSLDLRKLLRPAMFVPESRKLNLLLRDLRVGRTHMALVVNEHGEVAGLITIEDILEQIVGDIEDEYDEDENAGNIVADHDGRWRVRALTEIADFNAAFGTDFADDRADTIGGFVTDALGRMPHRGDAVEAGGLRFEVLRADARQVHLLLVTRLSRSAADEFGALDAATKASGVSDATAAADVTAAPVASSVPR
jgi:magnesium and cobalt transporter